MDASQVQNLLDWIHGNYPEGVRRQHESVQREWEARRGVLIEWNERQLVRTEAERAVARRANAEYIAQFANPAGTAHGAE